MTIRDFSGKTVLVTGAGGGLGRALCLRFAKAGARVAGLDVDAGALESLKRELDGLQAESAAAVADLTDEAAVLRAVGELRGRLGPIHTLICNAGITHLKNFDGSQAAPIRRVMDVNFMGSVHTVAACYDDVVSQSGAMAAISSVAGYAPLIGRTGYCASKHALHGFFDTLRCELRHTGVDVTLVCPSYIATGIRRRFESAEPDTGAPDPSDSGGKGRTVGSEMTPEQAAEQIFQAVSKRRRLAPLGRVGHFSWWCRKLAPRLYEHLMQRSIQDE